MRSRRLRELVRGPAPDGERIFWTSLWFTRLNNARYAERLPRLDRLDAYFQTVADARIRRGLAYRAYRGPLGDAWLRAVLHRAAARYGGVLCTELRQIDLFPGPVVVDMDD